MYRLSSWRQTTSFKFQHDKIEEMNASAMGVDDHYDKLESMLQLLKRLVRSQESFGLVIQIVLVCQFVRTNQKPLRRSSSPLFGIRKRGRPQLKAVEYGDFVNFKDAHSKSNCMVSRGSQV